MSGNLRPDLALIADWIPAQSNVLDLGCGDGALMAWLQGPKACTGYGVEIMPEPLVECARRGVDVIQANIEQGLGMFVKGQFDVVVLSMAIQSEKVLRGMSSVGREGIVSFPNFGHWFHIWSIARGRMPVSREMPYTWYDTPNLHLATLADFEDLLGKLGLVILDKAFMDNGRRVHTLASWRATQAFYRFRAS
jgi:methionine biosynthesis protein MetW